MSKEKLLKDIKEIANNYDWLVVEDIYTENKHIYGSNTEYDNIKYGGGKFAIIDTNEIKADYILFNEQYNTVEEFVDIILEYWN